MIERYVSPEEVRRLISAFLGVLIALTLLGVFACIVVPGLRGANRPVFPPSDVSSAGQTGWLDETEYPPMKGYVVPPVDPNSLISATAELLATGKTLYEKNCAQCHGPNGEGSGPSASGLNPAPRNFTQPTGWTNGFGLAAVYKTLSEGVAGSAMASFDYLRPAQRMALDHYVQSLGHFARTPEPAAELDALRGKLASVSVRVPNKIPVSLAMKKLEKEYVAPHILALPTGPGAGPGARLAAMVITDPVRAALVLQRSRGWKESPAALATVVMEGMPSNGFNVEAVALSANDWRLLYEELLQRAAN
jgi:mono/diheme cytochrome c family protein